MHTIRVVRPRYQQARRYQGQQGEVVGRWGADTNEKGREGYMVAFPDGEVVAISTDEAQDVLPDGPTDAEAPEPGRPGAGRCTEDCTWN